MRIYRNSLYLICLLVVQSWFAGCSTLSHYTTVPPLQLTPVEQARVGNAVEERLIQMLGGPYHDKTLASDLNRHLRQALSFKISVADRSAAALYPLPGGRVIITRGFLAKMNSQSRLDACLAEAVQLSHNLYADRVTRDMAEATEEVLAASASIYVPDSAAIRLARIFEHTPSGQDCLSTVQSSGTLAGKAGSSVLPDSIKRLSDLQPGYELAASARQAEHTEAQTRAIALYLQAAAAAPDEPWILGSLGLAYLRAGQLQPARLHLQKAVKLQPDYYRTQMGLGYLYLQQGKFSQANQALLNSVRMLPVTENLFLLAETREKSGDMKGAISLYRLIVAFDRTSKLGRASVNRLEQLAGVK